MGQARNEPCACGSGRKYKQCCLGKPLPQERKRRKTMAAVIVALALAGAVVVGIFYGLKPGFFVGIGGLFAAGGYLIVADAAPSKGRDGSSGINFGN